MANILVVEDDEIMLKDIKNILSKDGHNVILAKNGKEAFDKLEHADYDLVLSDLMMPSANGLEVISRQKNDPTTKHVNIIVVSSVGNEETITEAFRLGADDYLKKPIMAGELLIRIRKLLASRTAQHSL